MRTVLIHTFAMENVTAAAAAPSPGVRLSELGPGATGTVVGVGSPERTVSPLERRLLELGFVHGEHVEVVAEARPGRDPFVVRVGCTTLALRRSEADSVWIGGALPA